MRLKKTNYPGSQTLLLCCRTTCCFYDPTASGGYWVRRVRQSPQALSFYRYRGARLFENAVESFGLWHLHGFMNLRNSQKFEHINKYKKCLSDNMADR